MGVSAAFSGGPRKAKPGQYRLPKRCLEVMNNGQSEYKGLLTIRTFSLAVVRSRKRICASLEIFSRAFESTRLLQAIEYHDPRLHVSFLQKPA